MWPLSQKSEAARSAEWRAGLRRARLYREVGADVVFFEAPQSEAEIEARAEHLAAVPLPFNWAEGGKTLPITHARLQALGFRIIIFLISALLAATRGMRDVLETSRRDGAPWAALPGLPRFGWFLHFIGLPEVQNLE
jgi:2-methylisocitrate lyase-like PEP mutase family enzyme